MTRPTTYYHGYDVNSNPGTPYGSWSGLDCVSESPAPSAYDSNPGPWQTEVAEYRGRALLMGRDGSYHSRRGGHGWTFVTAYGPDERAEGVWRSMVDSGLA